jgi:hypothetical protein
VIFNGQEEGSKEKEIKSQNPTLGFFNLYFYSLYNFMIGSLCII